MRVTVRVIAAQAARFCRNVAEMAAAAAQWLGNFAISTTFPALADLGLAFAYGLYTFFAVMSFLFVAKFVRETKGRQLEDAD